MHLLFVRVSARVTVIVCVQVIGAYLEHTVDLIQSFIYLNLLNLPKINTKNYSFFDFKYIYSIFFASGGGPTRPALLRGGRAYAAGGPTRTARLRGGRSYADGAPARRAVLRGRRAYAAGEVSPGGRRKRKKKKEKKREKK